MIRILTIVGALGTVSKGFEKKKNPGGIENQKKNQDQPGHSSGLVSLF